MKLQASIFKPQGSFKPQAPILKLRENDIGGWMLRFPWSLKVEDWNFLARGLSLFLGGFCLVNLLGQYRFPRFDANLWWIDLHWFPQSVANVFLLFCAVPLIAFGIRVPRSG